MKHDKNIVRARVLNKSELLYTVFLIDIGNSKTVCADDIFEIPNDLKNVSTLCLFVLFY